MFELKKNEILRELWLIKRLSKEGKTVYCGEILNCKFLKIEREEDLGGVKMKVMFVVWKKMLKKAVDRNRIRRRMREAFRRNRVNFYFHEPVVLKFVYKKNYLVKYNDIEADFIKILKLIS